MMSYYSKFRFCDLHVLYMYRYFTLDFNARVVIAAIPLVGESLVVFEKLDRDVACHPCHLTYMQNI